MGSKFRFESVLQYRRHLAEAAEMELAAAQRQLASAEEYLQSLKAGWQTGHRRLALCLQKKVDGEQLQLWRLYLTDLENRIAEAAAKMEAVQLVVEDRRGRLIEATREKKVMEKLKDRHTQGLRLEEARQQNKELAELAVQMHAGRFS